jgi:RNA polymerase sigma-70 factor (ECF subfamily)
MMVTMVDLDAALHGQPVPARAVDRVDPAEPRHDRLRAMVDAHFDVVWRSLCRLGVASDSVDDATQQVFLVASRKVDVIEVGGERPYLLGIAVRVAADARRARKRRREVPEEEAAEPEATVPTAEDLVDQKRARELLDRVLATMPDELREVFVLFEVEDVGVAQIATMLGIPVGTVGSRIRRARELFHKRVSRSGSGTRGVEQ